MPATDASPKVTPDTRAKQPRAKQGAEIIKQRIKQGIYRPGEQLPSLRTLSSELNLSFTAVQRAVRQLEREGLLESKHGVGIRILDSAHCGSTPLLFGFVQPYFSGFSLALQEFLEDALDDRSNLCVTKTTRNDPARERREIERLINSGVNGLLIWPVDDDTNGEFLQEVSQRLPVVFVDRTLEGVRAPSVVIDYEKGARQIVRDLHKRKKTRILVVCDPVNLSSFNQLKAGLRQEAETLRIADSLKVVDYPVLKMIEAAQQDDYTLSHACYEVLAPMLESGEYDALFCPQDELFNQVFAESKHTKVLSNVDIVTLTAGYQPRFSQSLLKLNIHLWVADTTNMMLQAVNLLQDMTLSRQPLKRTIKVPMLPKKKSARPVAKG